MVLDTRPSLPQEHPSLQRNLFELGQIAAADEMAKLGAIEQINLDMKWSETAACVATSHQTQLVADLGDLRDLAGIICLRRIAASINDADWRLANLEKALPSTLSSPPRLPYSHPCSSFRKIAITWRQL